MEKRGNENRHRVHHVGYRGAHLQEAGGAAYDASEEVGRCGNGGKRGGLEGNGREEGLFGDEEKRREQSRKKDGEHSVRVFEEKKIENVDAHRHDVRIGALLLKDRRELGPQRLHVLVVGNTLGAGSDSARHAHDRLCLSTFAITHVQIALVGVGQVGGDHSSQPALHDEKRHELAHAGSQPLLAGERLWWREERRSTDCWRERMHVTRST